MGALPTFPVPTAHGKVAGGGLLSIERAWDYRMLFDACACIVLYYCKILQNIIPYYASARS